MTEENQKKLYEHYLKTNQTARAEETLTRYPHFKEAPKPPKSKAIEKDKKSE